MTLSGTVSHITLSVRYIESSQMSALDEVYVSQASADQRKGRAGRVREGVCFRLYTRNKSVETKATFCSVVIRVHVNLLKPSNVPEFL